MNFKTGNKLKAVTFSYDDGITQDIRLIELLNKYGLKCTFNLNSSFLGGNRVLQVDNKRISHYKIGAEDVKYVYDGHEVAVHTLTHPRLTRLDKAEIIRQVEQDRIKLSELSGYEVVGMAYPYGDTDDTVAEIIKTQTGVEYCRTVANTDSFDIQQNLYCFNPNAFHLQFERLMQMGRDFVELKADKPQIFYIWGHSYEMDYESDCWVRLEEFFKLISNKDDIFYGTNKEVLL